MYFPPAAGAPIGEPVVLLTGSGGGIFDKLAALLASNGHPALALGLYNYKDLPKTLLNLPLEQIRDGAQWLAQQSGSQRTVVLGVSRGSEAAQLAAAYFPDAFSGVVAEVPSHLVGGALGPGTTPKDAACSLGGKPIPPFDGPDFDLAKITETAKTLPGYSGTVDLLPAWNDPAVEAKSGIPYDRIKAPLLILAAGSDGIWPSYISAERIRNRMSALGKADQVEIHVYPNAGHGMVIVGRGNPLSNVTYNTALKGYMTTGGMPNGDCEASFQAVDEVLRFLRRVKSNH
jgi:pimeloyl-ACP methyl ester carboxylesterase